MLFAPGPLPTPWDTRNRGCLKALSAKSHPFPPLFGFSPQDSVWEMEPKTSLLSGLGLFTHLPREADSGPFSGTHQSARSHSFYSTSPVSPSPHNILLVSGVCAEIYPYLGCFVLTSLSCTLSTLRFPKSWPLVTYKAETHSLYLPLAATALPRTVGTEWPRCLHEGKGKTAGVGVLLFSTCHLSPPTPCPPTPSSPLSTTRALSSSGSLPASPPGCGPGAVGEDAGLLLGLEWVLNQGGGHPQPAEPVRDPQAW